MIILIWVDKDDLKGETNVKDEFDDDEADDAAEDGNIAVSTNILREQIILTHFFLF